ncbi:hypothetical protein [Halorussus lipolyticus]|uniref:hypothetical protein n=1 Tax=Halorussus lipolyticus TaxID=3034024 RepID=UPI0023E7FC2C|nr:hypothetical protein [Halorussus sp. DT80]
MVSRRQVLAGGCLALTGSGGCSQIRDAVTDDATSDVAETSDETTGASDETTADADAGEFRIAVTDADREIELVTGADVASVGEIEEARTGDGYRLPITLTDAGTEAFASGLEQAGAFENPQSHRIRTYFEGELLYEAKLGPGLADAIESGEWGGEFLLTTTDRAKARELKEALEGS